MKSQIGDILLFALKGYWLFCFMGPGQGEVNAKQKGKGKRRGNPSFCRYSANHGHSVEAGV